MKKLEHLTSKKFQPLRLSKADSKKLLGRNGTVAHVDATKATGDHDCTLNNTDCWDAEAGTDFIADHIPTDTNNDTCDPNLY